MAVDILGNGWNISEQGQVIITENNAVKEKSAILKNALNSDLKEIGSPILSKIINKGNVSQVVLQIQKVRNISAPKANENSHVAPRMLKLVLTDGDTYIQAVEVSSIPAINLDKTSPGSKILIHSAKISSGYLLLNSNNCSLLGGQVPALYEKWQLAKSVQYHNRQNYSSSDGPPAWVNFGSKIQSQTQDKQFKSIDNKSQEVKENTKFEMQRQDAIAEATSGAVKKVFGGSVKVPVQQPVNYNQKKNEPYNKERKFNKLKSNGGREMDDQPQKPCERVSLFEFLEDKLPANESNTNFQNEHPKPIVNSTNQHAQQNNRYKNNQGPKYGGYKSESNQSNSQNRFRKEHAFDVSQQRNEANVDVNGLTNNMGKMSLNSQFASRSLRQHLNLGGPKKNNQENEGNAIWKVGDVCLAKYWEDGKFYEALITAVTEKTCVVQFKGYGNIEEVLKTDCLPKVGNESNKKTYSGPMEFRRNPRMNKRQ